MKTVASHPLHCVWWGWRAIHRTAEEEEEDVKMAKCRLELDRTGSSGLLIGHADWMAVTQ